MMWRGCRQDAAGRPTHTSTKAKDSGQLAALCIGAANSSLEGLKAGLDGRNRYRACAAAGVEETGRPISDEHVV